MTDPLSIANPPPPVAPAVAPAAAAPAVELLTPLPVMPTVASFAATVIGRNPEGAILLRSAWGTFSIKSSRSLPTGARVELRFDARNPPSLAIVSVATDAAGDDAPPMQLDLGTTMEATVLTPGKDAGDVAAGTHLLVRILAPFLAADPATTLSGQVLAGAANETLVETPIGTLALDRPLALPPGTAIALVRLGATAHEPGGAAPPSQVGGWPALDQALAALDNSAPMLAAELRAALAPSTPAALAGTLLFLMGALYRGRWPGAAIERALDAAGAQKLRQRLGGDVAELMRLSTDASTDPWRVLVLPFLADAGVQPLRVYLYRGGRPDGGNADTRFVIDAELSRLGALQLDGKVRGRRLDLVLRSHAPLAAALRQEAEALFHRVSNANGLHGDIVFATAAQFAVSPLSGHRPHVAVEA